MDAGINETRMRMLGELAEMALVLARDLQQNALDAKTAEEKIRFADAFHRVSRGMRQSLALHAKFERDAERPVQAAAPAPDPKARREARAATLKREVERLIWTEREKLEEDPFKLRLRLTNLLATEAKAEDFLETDPATQIARLCEMLGVPTAHFRAGGNPSRAPASPAADSSSATWIPGGVYPRAGHGPDPGAGTSGAGDGPFHPSG